MEVRSVVELARAADDAWANANYGRAAALLEQAVRLEPAVSVHRMKLGLAYERQAESAAFPARLVRKARHNLRQAVLLQPADPEAIASLAELAYLPPGVCYGDLDEAAMLLERLGLIDPARAELGRAQLASARADASSIEYRVRCGAVSARQWAARQCRLHGNTNEIAYRPAGK